MLGLQKYESAKRASIGITEQDGVVKTDDRVEGVAWGGLLVAYESNPQVPGRQNRFKQETTCNSTMQEISGQKYQQDCF